MTPEERRIAREAARRAVEAHRRQPAAPQQPAAVNNRPAPAAPAVSPKVQFWLVVGIGLFLLFTGTFVVLRISGGVRNTFDYEASAEGKDFVLAREQTRKLEERTKQEQERTKQIQAAAAVNPAVVAGLLPIANAASPVAMCDNFVVFSVKAGETQNVTPRDTWKTESLSVCKPTHGLRLRADDGTTFTARPCNSSETPKRFTTEEVGVHTLTSMFQNGGCGEVTVARGRFYVFMQRN